VTGVLKQKKANVRAIVKEYWSANLDFDPKMGTVWVAGKLVMGPIPQDKFSVEDTVSHVEKWESKHGKGHVCIETRHKQPDPLG